jgi:predicted dehydrogenase
MNRYRVAIIGAGHRAGAHDRKGESSGSHAWAYHQVAACELVAAADPNEANLHRLCDLYDIPGRYANYREMLAEIQPDIVSVSTGTRPRAEIIVYAAEHRVKAIYAEKALCGSMAEADLILSTCERTGVIFNQGTNRRFDAYYGVVRGAIVDGSIGEPVAVMFHGQSLLMHGCSHVIDTMLFLLGDPEVEFVQGRLGVYEEWGEKWLPEGRKFFNKPIFNAAENCFESDPTLGINDFTADPGTDWGIIRFRNGTTGHLINSPSLFDFMILGSMGQILCSEETPEFLLRQRKERFSRAFETQPLSLPERENSTVCIISDLIEALEQSHPTKCPVEIAHRGMEIALGLAESHVRDGAKVTMPLENRTLYVPNH